MNLGAAVAKAQTAVALTRCSSYDSEVVDRAVRTAVDLLGGISLFVRPGQRVLLKPNLLSASSPESAIATHPAVVEAVARLVLQAGATVVLADSPGGPFTAARLERCYRETGMSRAAEATGMELNFSTDSAQHPCPNGLLLKRVDIIEVILGADVVIGLSKLKTHCLMTLTGATKLMFGAVPGTVKASYHAKLKTPAQFATMLLDVCRFVKPALHLVDAVVGMEGNGPSGGTPREIGVILAGTDATSVDTVAASILGIQPLAVPTILAAVEHGLSSGQLRDCQVLGERVQDCLVQGFRHADRGLDFSLMPGFARNALTNQLVLRPRPSRSQCTACGVCVENCPVDAITIRDSLAVVDYRRCIRCYCCHELCPDQAIDLVRGKISSLLARL